MNNMEVNTEEQLPSHYEIVVSSMGDELSYPEVHAFKIENQMLQFLWKTTTVIIPINENVSCIEITPVYLEEKRIVQVP